MERVVMVEEIFPGAWFCVGKLSIIS